MEPDNSVYREILDNLYDAVYFVDKDKKSSAGTKVPNYFPGMIKRKY
jgi:hypothetical protein